MELSTLLLPPCLHGAYRGSFTFTVSIYGATRLIFIAEKYVSNESCREKRGSNFYLIQFTVRSYGFLDN